MQKVGGYPTEKTPQSQELPPPLLEVLTILASARGHGGMARAKIVSTSNSGGGSNVLRRVAMAFYGRQKN